jgi:hypothetical protein
MDSTIYFDVFVLIAESRRLKARVLTLPVRDNKHKRFPVKQEFPKTARDQRSQNAA